MTSVYEKTHIHFFKEAVDCVLKLTHEDFEWVLLINGPVPSELRLLVESLASKDKRVRIFEVPSNLGIVGAMKFCLGRAACEYAVPLDADDLVTPDALAILASEAEKNAFPELLYSDEDFLRGGIFCDPFFRPDWDPILNLNNSYVWHLCAIHRKTALELGVYQDPAAERCHDWDTVTRIWLSGGRIIHVPEVLYHWRAHESSTSNREELDNQSFESQKAVLQRVIDHKGIQGKCYVDTFPIFRGAQEASIRFRVRRLSRLNVLIRGSSEEARRHIVAGLSGVADEFRVWDGDWEGLLGWVSEASPNEWVYWIDGNIRFSEFGWINEVERLSILQGDLLVAVSGRTLRGGHISGGPGIRGFGRVPFKHMPFGPVDQGRGENDAGYFAMALKERCVNSPDPQLFAVRAYLLRDVLADAAGPVSNFAVACDIGARAIQDGNLVGFTPLFSAHSTISPGYSLTKLEWKAFERRFAGSRSRDTRWYSKYFSAKRGRSYRVEF